jgi:hypothetical protein
MDKQQLIEKVKEKKYSHEQLLGWVNALPGSSHFKKPSVHKVGDVFMHCVFKHPYVLLKKSKNGWICGLFTTEENCPEILETCQSRFFNNNYNKSIIHLTSEVAGTFLGVYDNMSHLKICYLKIKNELTIK